MNALFTSDNVTGACPEVMDAVVATNSGIAVSYGDDEWSSSMQTKFSEIFEKRFDKWLDKNVPNYLDKYFRKK